VEVQVTNGNTYPLLGRFDGRNYVFAPGTPIAVPEEAANHIFGLRQRDKNGAMNRLGLLKPGVTYEEALAALNRVTFTAVLVRVVFESPEPQPPPKPPRPPPARDERMQADEVRASLQRLLAQAPYGGKRPLALALGFRGRWALHSLRSIARGRGYLFEAVRRRLSHRVQQVERGDLILIATGHYGAGKRLFTVVAAEAEEGMASVQGPQRG
jgi:hypothetical protein